MQAAECQASRPLKGHGKRTNAHRRRQHRCQRGAVPATCPPTGEQREPVRATQGKPRRGQHQHARSSRHVGQRRVLVQQDVRHHLAGRPGLALKGRVWHSEGHGAGTLSRAAAAAAVQHGRLHWRAGARIDVKI